MGWKRKTVEAVNWMLRPSDLRVVRANEITESWTPLEWSNHPSGVSKPPFSGAFLRSYLGRAVSPQEPAGFAVVMQSMLRSKLAKAVESVYEQQFDGTVQLLIGVDILEGDAFDVEPICRQIPDRHSILFFYPGYSTSR